MLIGNYLEDAAFKTCRSGWGLEHSLVLSRNFWISVGSWLQSLNFKVVWL